MQSLCGLSQLISTQELHWLQQVIERLLQAVWCADCQNCSILEVKYYDLVIQFAVQCSSRLFLEFLE